MKAIFILALLAISLSIPVQEENWGLIRRELGIGLFVYGKPAREFDTVCSFKTKKDFLSYPGPSTAQKIAGINRSLDYLMQKAIKRLKKKKDIDAIITIDARNAIGIKYRDNVADVFINKSIALTYKDYLIFVQNTPVNEFSVLKHITFNTLLTINSKIEYSFTNLLDSLIFNYEKIEKIEKADAIITENGVEADFIKFKLK